MITMRRRKMMRIKTTKTLKKKKTKKKKTKTKRNMKRIRRKRRIIIIFIITGTRIIRGSRQTDTNQNIDNHHTNKNKKHEKEEA